MDIQLFNGVANYLNVIPNSNHFVGLRIRIKKGESIINKVGCQFKGNVNGLTIYLFHSSQKEPLTTIKVNHTNSITWTDLCDNNILRYISDDYDAGGDFFIGYKQSELEDLGGKALKMDINWRSKPCECDSKWSEWYRNYSPVLDIVGFEMDENLFDPENVSIRYTNNYGLNLNISI